MNRPIKFRAWDKKNKTMNTLITLQWLETLYIGGVGFFNEVMYELDDTIALMQFTGLHDKNGKECFEADKVENRLTPHKGIVKWDDESACFAVFDENDKWVGSMGAFASDGFTITGNKYEG